jgi:hypothetical protein
MKDISAGKKQISTQIRVLRIDRGNVGKALVIGVIFDEGQVFAKHVEVENKKTFQGVIIENIDTGSVIVNANLASYKGFDWYEHITVK